MFSPVDTFSHAKPSAGLKLVPLSQHQPCTKRDLGFSII